jgi:hypothetical protein
LTIHTAAALVLSHFALVKSGRERKSAICGDLTEIKPRCVKDFSVRLSLSLHTSLSLVSPAIPPSKLGATKINMQVKVHHEASTSESPHVCSPAAFTPDAMSQSSTATTAGSGWVTLDWLTDFAVVNPAATTDLDYLLLVEWVLLRRSGQPT